MTAETASGRLRRRLDRELVAYARPGRLLIKSDRAAELWPSYLSVAYHFTCFWITAMRAAKAHSESHAFAHDPVARELAVYLERHIEEEMHPSRAGGIGGAIMDDLHAVGAVPEACPSRLTDYFVWLDHLIHAEHPVAILGSVQLERFHPTLDAVKALRAATGLPTTAMRQMFLHTVVDERHTQEMDALLDAMPLRFWQEDLVTEAAVAALAAVRDSLLDVVTPEAHRFLGWRKR